MKKLLILAFDFPPYVSVGGLRPYNWYRYLKEFDIEPVVITRQWSNVHGNHLDYIAAGSSNSLLTEKTEFGEIIRTPYHPNLANRLMLKHGENKYRLLRKSISGYYEITQFVSSKGPKSELFKGAREYLKVNKIDAIIATGDPFVLFSYASKLSKEFGVPWIADYRDPWSHNKEHSNYFIQKAWNTYFEKKTVSTASHVITVSNFVHSKINELIPNKPFSILPNGYDPVIIDEVRTISQNSNELSIAFVGTIYNWHPLDSFLNVANSFLLNNPEAKMKFRFYGTNISNDLNKMVNEKYPRLKEHVLITSKIPNAELLKNLASDNVMLLFNYYSFMGTKIFDYLGIKRKMILCYSDDPDANELKKKYYTIDESSAESKHLQTDLIQETNSGIIVKDSTHLKEVLQDLYTEFLEKGSIACDSVGVEKYSRKIQVEKLAQIVKELSSKSK